MARVLILLPARDFDPSEAAMSWQVLLNAGHSISFATPDGKPAAADDMMLTGRSHDAAAGQAMGISQYLVDAGKGLEMALGLAGKVCANAPMTNFAVIHALLLLSAGAAS